MKKIILYLFVTIAMVQFTSCGSNEEKEQIERMSYSEVLTSLIYSDTDLSSISRVTQIPVDQLIKIKYGLIPENDNLTKYLKKLKYTCVVGDTDDVADMMKDVQEFDIVLTSTGKKIDRNIYKASEYKCNDNFQQELPIIGQNLFNKKIEKFIHDKYSMLSIPCNIWNYIINSKEEYLAQYRNELQSSLNVINLNQFLQQRINAYADMLETEHEVLFGLKNDNGGVYSELNIPKFDVRIDSDSQKKIIDHAVLDLMDFAMNVAEETVIAFIIWGVISLIIYILIKVKVKNETEKYFRLIHKKSDGLLRTLGKMAIAGIVAAKEEEDQKDKIRKKWRRRHIILNFVVTLGLGLWGYFYVTVPSVQMELDVEKNLQEQTDEYFNNLDMWIITELNQITNKL
jgi:hypothetical protein